ncbi:MAG: MFS transporter [Bacteroidetes bacterium]|nr:MAG: MFS transporter [Bacteroidota bacterium]
MSTEVSILKLSQKRVYRIAVSSFFFLAGLCFSSWASRIPDVQAKLHLNNASLGAVLLSLPTGLLISLPFAGWLVAKFGSRLVVIGASFLYALTLPLLGLANNTPELVACLFIFGMGGNMLNISVNTQAVGTEAIYQRSIMASYHGLWSLAGFSGAAIGTLAVKAGILPWQHFFVICILALAMIFVAYRYLLTEDVNKQEERPIFVKPDRSLINLGLIAFCCMICEGAMFDWSGVYFRKVVQPENGLVTLGFTAFMSTMATGRFVGDWVATRFGKKKTLQISGILTAGGLLIAVLFPYFVTAVTGFLFVGAGVSSVVPLIYSSAGKSKILSPGVAIAAVSTIGYLGFLFGPPFIGFIAQASSLRISLGLVAVLGSIIALIATRNKFQ